jgi:hypothetical protein
LSGLLVVAAALRLPGLDESLWFDELYATHVRLGSLWSLAETTATDFHPPLYRLLMFGWIRVFGDGEISVRLIPLAAGLFSICVVYALGRMLFSTVVGLTAASLVAISPTHIWYSQEARHYCIWMALVLLAAFAYGSLGRSRRTNLWLTVHGVALIAAVSIHFYSIAVAGVFAAVALLDRHRTGARTVLVVNLVAIAGLLGFVAAKYLIGILHTGSTYLRALGPFELWMTWFEWFPSGHALIPGSIYSPQPAVFLGTPLVLAAALLLTVLLGLGIRAAYQQWASTRDSMMLVLIGLLVAIPSLLVLMRITGFGATFIERSLLPSMPFVFLLIAAGLFSIRSVGLRAAAGAGMAAYCLTSLVVHLSADAGRVYKPNPDWRTAAERLLQEPDGRSPILTTSPADVLTYYDDAFRRASLDPDEPGSLERWVMSYGLAPPPQSGQPRFPIYNYTDVQSRLEAVTKPPVNDIYLVRNKVWEGDYEEMEAAIESSPHFDAAGTIEADHLSIKKFRVIR